MKCRNVQKNFSAYQDKELKHQEQEDIRSHLSSCQSCRDKYAEFERLWLTLGELEVIHTDPWFYRQLAGKIKEPLEQGLLSTFRHVFQFLHAPAIVSVLLAAGILAGIYLGNVMVRSEFLPFGRIATGYSQEAILDSLKIFDPAPPGTLAHGYLQMVNDEEKTSR